MRHAREPLRSPTPALVAGALVVGLALGAIVYPNYRIGARVFMENLRMSATVGFFEMKEHLVSMGLALLPAYWYFWRQPLKPEHERTRKIIVLLLALFIWGGPVLDIHLHNRRDPQHVFNHAEGSGETRAVLLPGLGLFQAYRLTADPSLQLGLAVLAAEHRLDRRWVLGHDDRHLWNHQWSNSGYPYGQRLNGLYTLSCIGEERSVRFCIQRYCYGYGEPGGQWRQCIGQRHGVYWSEQHAAGGERVYISGSEMAVVYIIYVCLQYKRYGSYGRHPGGEQPERAEILPCGDRQWGMSRIQRHGNHHSGSGIGGRQHIRWYNSMYRYQQCGSHAERAYGHCGKVAVVDYE